VLENRRRIFGHKKDKVTGEWRELHSEDLNDLYCAPSVVRVIKLKRMRWGKERHIQGYGGETSGKETTWKTQA